MTSTDGMTFEDLMGGEKTDSMVQQTEKRPRSCSYLGWTEAMDAIVSKTKKSAIQVVVGEDWRGDKAVLIQNQGETGNWPIRFETPPMVANWPRLSGDGNLGGKFAPEKKDASFEVNLCVGELGQVEDDLNKNEITLDAQKSFVDNIRDRCMETFKLMWETEGLNSLLEQKKNEDHQAVRQDEEDGREESRQDGSGPRGDVH